MGSNSILLDRDIDSLLYNLGRRKKKPNLDFLVYITCAISYMSRNITSDYFFVTWLFFA